MPTYYVSTNGDNSNDGSQLTPFATIPYAVQNASANDVIFVVADGTHELTSQLVIDKPLSIIGRENGVGTRPLLHIRTVDNGRAVRCQVSNVLLVGLDIEHKPLPGDDTFSSYENSAYTGSVIEIVPGTSGSGLDDGESEVENIVIDDCKLHFYRCAVLSGAKTFELKNSELYCKFDSNAVDRSSHVLLYGMNGVVNIKNNTLTTNGFNTITLVHVVNNSGDGYTEHYNGTLNILENEVSGGAKLQRVYGSSLLYGGSGVLSVNIKNNVIEQTDGDLETVLISENRNLNTAYQLVTIAYNSYINNIQLSHFVGLIPVNDPSNATYPDYSIVSPVQPRFCIHSNNVQNILTLNFMTYDNPYTVYIGANKELYLQTTSELENSVFPSDISNILITYQPGTYMLCDMTNTVTIDNYDTSYNMSGIYSYETDRLGATTSTLPPLFMNFSLDVNEFVAGIEVSPLYSLDSPDNNAATDDIFVYSTRMSSEGHLQSQSLQQVKWTLSNTETASVAYSDYIVNDTGVVMPINEDVRSGNILIEVEGTSRKDASNNNVIHFSIGGIAPKIYTKYDNPYSADGVFVSNNDTVVPNAPGQLGEDILVASTDQFVSVQQSLLCVASLDTIALSEREVNDLVHAIIADQNYDENNTIEKIRTSVANRLDGLISNNTTNVTFSVSMSTNNNSSSNTVNSNSVGPTDVPVKTWVSFN